MDILICTAALPIESFAVNSETMRLLVTQQSPYSYDTRVVYTVQNTVQDVPDTALQLPRYFALRGLRAPIFFHRQVKENPTVVVMPNESKGTGGR